MHSLQAGIVLSVVVLMALDNVYNNMLMNFIIAQSPSDELRMALSSGFPTDGSSLYEVQHCTALLNQTYLNNPTYVHSLFVAHYMGRIIFPMVDWQLILWFGFQCYVWISSEMGFDEREVRVVKPIFPSTTNFYLYTAAGALYGKWGGIVLCITLSTLANALSLSIILLVLILFHGFVPEPPRFRRRLRNRRRPRVRRVRAPRLDDAELELEILQMRVAELNLRVRAGPPPLPELPNLLDRAQLPALPEIPAPQNFPEQAPQDQAPIPEPPEPIAFQELPALPELEEPEVEEEEPAPPTNWAYILPMSMALFIVGAPLLPLVPSWLANCLLAHLYLMAHEAEYPRALILLMPALGRIPYLWYCVSTGPGIHQMDSLEGIFNCGFMYVAAFVGSLAVMGIDFDLLSHIENLF